MKTRVVRYWSGTTFLYRVEEFRDLNRYELAMNAAIDEAAERNAKRLTKGGIYSTFVSPLGYRSKHEPGEHWRFVSANLSREYACDMAEAIARKNEVPDCDVVAEYGV